MKCGSPPTLRWTLALSLGPAALLFGACAPSPSGLGLSESMADAVQDAQAPTAAAATEHDAALGADAAPVAPPPAPRSDGPRTAFVHLFEWRWDDIADECEEVLGPTGYAAVQVSPPQEHAQVPSRTWWQRYQPVSYRLESRGGDRAAFARMVRRCKAAGVDIYVDAVLNHMSFQPEGVGSAGSPFRKYAYPGLYTDDNFHRCRRPIGDWNSRTEIHTCELATCPDLATEQPAVRATLTAYLQDLVDLGVAGVRIDAAKHIPVADLNAILSGVRGPLYVYQEVLDTAGTGPVTAWEHLAVGDVTELRYGLDVSRIVREGRLPWLRTLGEAWGYLPSHAAIAFIDNHDNQRGHGAGQPLTHKERDRYLLASVFLLAWPYGYPAIMSSYAFTGGDDGPPAAADGTTESPRGPGAACNDGWICEHRWPAVRGMVGFRNATAGAFTVTHEWNDGKMALGFGRGSDGFVVLNGSSDGPLEGSFATGLAPGRYCDVVAGPPEAARCSGATLEVDDAGRITVAVPPLGAVAVHRGSRLRASAPPPPEASRDTTPRPAVPERTSR